LVANCDLGIAENIGFAMPLGNLDHVNIRSSILSEMIEWYQDVLGMVNGFRPKFSNNGAWMYLGDAPVVHLSLIDNNDAIGSERDLKLEHCAFSATGRAEFEANLVSRNQRYETTPLPQINLVQFNVWDPDGNHIHIDFPLDE
jgi:catechol 2,3-dioxygenase-like lactoylglutathione lyase family enzyme